MPKIEKLAGGIEVNVEEALQYLIGETKIAQEDGYYVLIVNGEGEHLQVTVDYERTKTDTEQGFTSIGKQCVFNELYSYDVYGENPFSFKQLIDDLHDQHLDAVENWLYGFLEEQYA
jgi:hypothetical protein